MTARSLLCALTLACVLLGHAGAQGTPVTILTDLDPNSAAGLRIEGLAADTSGNLYTADLDSGRLFKIAVSNGAVTVLGTLPRPGSGMAFDRAGNLYIASGDVIQRVPAAQLNAGSFDASAVTVFASGVPGANGLAFDGSGNLYVSGGNTGNIYLVRPDGSVSVFASGFTSDRTEQRISTNGLAFGPDGKLYSANTGSGAIDRITLKPEGGFAGVERWVTDQRLFGADGIAFAANGDLYVAANERNAIVRVTPAGQVSEVASNNNAGPLEFPASPAFSGNALYVSNFDIPRGANSPNDPGIGASVARAVADVAGLPLPVSQPAPAAPTPSPAPTVAPSPAPTVAPTTPAPSQPPAGGVPVSLPNTAAEPLPLATLFGIGLIALLLGMLLRRRPTP